MAEYIEREAAIDAVTEVYYNTPDVNLSGEKFEAAINGILSADVAPVVHGRWIMHDDELGLTCECSVCHIETMGDGNYCPNCGAKMNGGNQNV